MALKVKDRAKPKLPPVRSMERRTKMGHQLLGKRDLTLSK